MIIKQTPIHLFYGLELEIPSLCMMIKARVPISKYIQDCTFMLEGLNEFRRLSVQHVETMQRRRKVAFVKQHKQR